MLVSKRRLSSVTSPAPRPIPKKSKAATALGDRKFKQLGDFKISPFPDYLRPTGEEVGAVEKALLSVHGPPPTRERYRFEDDEEGAPVTDRGLADGVLDAVIRCILGLNTNARNYRVAKKGLDDRFGYGNYVAMQQAPLEDVVEALRPGGLSNVKGKAVKKILDDLNGRVQGMSISLKDSLEHVHDLDDKDAMKELLSLHGLGPKGAACIISYQLGRDMFAIDTHIFRITKALGWIPDEASRETAFKHLDSRIPGHLKYNLHLLFVQHGRACNNCRAGKGIKEEDTENCPLGPFLQGRQPGSISNVALGSTL